MSERNVAGWNYQINLSYLWSQIHWTVGEFFSEIAGAAIEAALPNFSAHNFVCNMLKIILNAKVCIFSMILKVN